MSRLHLAFQRILWGLFKKLVISERMAVIVNTIYGDYVTYSGLYIAVGTVCFAFQLYTDFSGSDGYRIRTFRGIGDPDGREF